MTSIDVAAGYDQLADLWNSDEFDRSNGIAQHKRAVAFCDQQRRALDVGCGSSGRIIELLQQHGFAVEGVDFSPRMLELAGKRHPQVTFHHADICDWGLPHQYDLISAWDSIWHVPLAQHEAVLRKLLTGGRLESIAVVELITHMEERYGVDFSARDFDPDDFDSIDTMAALVGDGAA